MNRRQFLAVSLACAYRMQEALDPMPTDPGPRRSRLRIRKASSVTVTAAERAHAMRNAGRYAWAAAERDAAVAAAARWRDLADDVLWRIVPGQELPRSVHVYNVFGTSKTALCPQCGEGIIRFGNYPWITDVFHRPWKIECPNCHVVLPSNDFAAYYRSALDVHGFFRKGGGDAKLLFNAEHPGPKDPMRAKWVDDGYGWHDAAGQRWDFVAVYVQWGLWAQIGVGIEALARAYTLTGDAAYAHKCGVLLARLADVYPDMDWWPLYRQGFSHSDGGSGLGRVAGRIWECGNGTTWSLAYDRAFDALVQDTALAAFVGAQHESEKLAAVRAPADLCEQIERNLIEQIVIGVRDGRIRGNEGAHQTTMLSAAIALDRPRETERLIEWTFAPGTLSPDPDNPGRARVTGGDLANVLVSIMDRDGLGTEGAPGYCMWGGSIQHAADLLERDRRYRSWSIYRRFPKFRRYFSAGRRWACLDAATPPIGDSGSTGAWDVVQPPADALVRAFRVYRDPELAERALRQLDGHLEAVHGPIFEPDPEGLQREVAALAPEPQRPLAGSLIDGFGLAILQAPHRDNARAVWMYFGRNTGHGHLDRLNVGLYAENLDMLPDLGYPEYASMRPCDLAWTRNNASHNVVTVDRAAQQPSYTGHVQAFEPEGAARLMTVESDGIYASAGVTRRTTWMVDVNERYSYMVDIVRVRGGSEHTLTWNGPSDSVTTTGLTLQRQPTGTFAGPDVPFEDLAPDWRSHAGDSFLYDVHRDGGPPQSFVVDYLGADLRGRIAQGREPHLRLHMLTPVDEVAVADGDPPQNRGGCPRRLKYVMLTRRGAELESVFVTVLEPYDHEPFITAVTVLPAQADSPEGRPVAVRVTTAGGRVDTIIACETACACSAGDVRLEGASCVVASRAGQVDIVKLMAGRRVQTGDLSLTADHAEYAGVVQAVLADKPQDQRLELSDPVPLSGRMPARLFVVRNDRVQDAAYTIARWIRGKTVSLGGSSLVRAYKDRNDPASGLALNVNPGDGYSIPTFAYVEKPGTADETRAGNVDFRVRTG